MDGRGLDKLQLKWEKGDLKFERPWLGIRFIFPNSPELNEAMKIAAIMKITNVSFILIDFCVFTFHCVKYYCFEIVTDCSIYTEKPLKYKVIMFQVTGYCLLNKRKLITVHANNRLTLENYVRLCGANIDWYYYCVTAQSSKNIKYKTLPLSLLVINYNFV